MYEVVYAPNGEMFEVLAEKAAQLKLNCGWSKDPPVVAPTPVAPEPKPVPAPFAPAPKTEPAPAPAARASVVDNDLPKG